MGRKRRQLNEYGQLYCPGCEKWLHLAMFYTVKTNPPWYIVDGIEYGRPQSRCRSCVLKYQQKRKAESPPGMTQIIKGPIVVKTKANDSTAVGLLSRPDWFDLTPAQKGGFMAALNEAEQTKLLDGTAFEELERSNPAVHERFMQERSAPNPEWDNTPMD
jgi:hypothetical protein